METGPASVRLPEDVKQVKLMDTEAIFPAAVTVARLDAYSVAKRLGETAKHTFGIDRALLATRLRQLATMVEENKVLPQKVSFSSEALIEDFTQTTMTFTFAEQVIPQVEKPESTSPKTMVAR